MIKLTEIESMLSEEDLFFKWLNEKRINYFQLSNMYIEYMKNEKHKLAENLSTYQLIAIHSYDKAKFKNKDNWIKEKIEKVWGEEKNKFWYADIHDKERGV